MDIEDITNHIRVSDLLASSGQPEEHQFKSIADAGYQVVINLAMPDSENAIAEEGNIVTSLEMTYVHIPVPFESPGIDHLKEFLDVMAAFTGRKVWVHCAVNYRVSACLYQYLRLTQGATDEEAGLAMLPSWRPDEVWRQFMALSSKDIGL